jgi:CheY-like chemotaxis protein
VSSELAVIIDDSATSRRILERLTAPVAGLAAHSFADARDALSFCREHRPDLVVVADPCGGGVAAAVVGRLRKVTAGPEVPVLVIASAD